MINNHFVYDTALLRIENKDKRTYYIEESCNNNWSARQLERQ
ncbi:MAG: hypothetical protein ACPGTO_01135 [Polaribacter sp.]